MILETDVGGDFKQYSNGANPGPSRSQNAVTDRHGLPPEDVSTVTVEVERPQMETVVKCMEECDFNSHERLMCVCVFETCDVRITVVTILKEIGGVCCLRKSS